jgi:antitoxin ParD1/3/4
LSNFFTAPDALRNIALLIQVSNVSEIGTYENVSEYIRDLIRRDKEHAEQQNFDRLKTELQNAFAAPDASYHALSIKEVIARNKQ